LAALAANGSKLLVAGSNRWSVAGFALIVISICLFSKEMPYPGWAALLPTVGAALIIAAGRKRSSIAWSWPTKHRFGSG
jgi:peptidoglycan/LPS O-acetylase OafA/YrhL